MLKWIDIIKFANQGTPPPDNKVDKTEEEWRQQLTEEQFAVTRQHGTERAFSSEMCERFEEGLYACVCCGNLLFDNEQKYDSGTGWPAFTQPVAENAAAYRKDFSLGMRRLEVLCNSCDAHLGHVFLDGPQPSGLRYCINSVALKRVANNERKVTLGGGCFWCTEAVFEQLKGVIKVESGYSGGSTINPTYREVSSGRTGHAEVVQITYRPEEITFSELLQIHLATHNPTLDLVAENYSQYRSIIFFRNEEERAEAEAVLQEAGQQLEEPLKTELLPFQYFYKAEAKHQDYYQNNPNGGYCQNVIVPKLAEFRKVFKDKLKK